MLNVAGGTCDGKFFCFEEVLLVVLAPRRLVLSWIELDLPFHLQRRLRMFVEAAKCLERASLGEGLRAYHRL